MKMRKKLINFLLINDYDWQASFDPLERNKFDENEKIIIFLF